MDPDLHNWPLKFDPNIRVDIELSKMTNQNLLVESNNFPTVTSAIPATKLLLAILADSMPVTEFHGGGVIASRAFADVLLHNAYNYSIFAVFSQLFCLHGILRFHILS